MWTCDLRPMRPDESKELTDLLSRHAGVERRVSITFISACLAGTVSALFLVFSGQKDTLGSVASLGVVGTTSLIGALVAYALVGRPDDEVREFCDELKEDLRRGFVEEFRVTAQGAVKIGPAGTARQGYLLDVGDGELMFVESREWDAAKDTDFDFEDIFPSSECSFVRAPRSGADLGFSCGGPRFAPSREVAAETALVVDLYLKDGDVFAGRLDSAESDFRRWCGCAFEPFEPAGI